MPRRAFPRQQLIDAGLHWIAHHGRYPQAEDVERPGNGLPSRPVLYRTFGNLAGYYQALREANPMLGESPPIRRRGEGHRGPGRRQDGEEGQGTRYNTSASPCDCEWCVAYATTRRCQCAAHRECAACREYNVRRPTDVATIAS